MNNKHPEHKTYKREDYVNIIGTYLYEKGFSPTIFSKKDENLMLLVKEKFILGVRIADSYDYIEVGYLSKEKDKILFNVNADTMKSRFNAEDIFKFLEGAEQGIKEFAAPEMRKECEFDNPAGVMEEYMRANYRR